MLRRTAWALAFSSLVLLRCGSDSSGDTASNAASGGKAGDASAGTGGTTDGSSGTGGINLDGSQGEVVSISIAPPDPVLEVLDGVIPAATNFVATGTLKAGGTITLSGGQWAYDRPDVGTLNPGSGAFTATGLIGGTGTVTYTLGQLSATTSATVKLHYTSDPGSVGATVKSALSGATTSDPSLALLYPYDATVFPRGLTGPVIQWNGGAASDIYYVHLTSPTFEYEEWNTVPPPSRWSFPTTSADIWQKLTESTDGAVTLAINRWDGSQAYASKTQTWTIAPANLAGTVYYWEVNSGNVVKLGVGDNAPKDFLQKPAGATCVACHSVSKNGSTLVAAFNGSASPWGTFDTQTGSSFFTYGVNPNDGPNGSGFQAIAPDGSLVLWGQERGYPYLSLSPFNAGTELAQMNPGGGFPVHPAWSSDGKQIAFAVRSDGNWLDFNHSTLWITDVDTSAKTFSNIKQIVAADAARPTVTFPTFSPDSAWIAFERSTQARSRQALSDIWLTSTDGATQIALDNANGTGTLQGAEASSTYEPTLMPVSAGGYFWMIVVGERTYGNTLTDTNPVSRHKQLWVVAIDASPQAGKDPSHPAFWLPGQDTNNNNMRGEWALNPCKQTGNSCTSGYDCCTGFCQPDGDGGFSCTPDKPTCSKIGEACKSAADCCDASAVCVGGFCAKKGVN
jgi:hypothetical protein